MKERHKMTANELAYELERPNNWQQENNFTTKAATMLRTIPALQAEIEDLKAKLQLHEAMDNQCASLMQQFRKAQEK